MSKRFSWRLRRAPLDHETYTRVPVAATLMPAFAPACPRLWRLFVAVGAVRGAAPRLRAVGDTAAKSRSSTRARVVLPECSIHAIASSFEPTHAMSTARTFRSAAGAVTNTWL